MVVDWMRIDRRPLLVGSFTQGRLTLSSRIASAPIAVVSLYSTIIND